MPQRQRKPMRRYLESLGYVIDRDLLIAMEGTRYCFKHPDGGTELDVFVERLNFCHPVEVECRLDAAPGDASPIEELLLEKLQIVELTTTDVIDLGAILQTHDIGAVVSEPAAGDEPRSIDAGHIAGLFARDWGFHHTATSNLRRPGGRRDAATDAARAHARGRARADRLLRRDRRRAEERALADAGQGRRAQAVVAGRGRQGGHLLMGLLRRKKAAAAQLRASAPSSLPPTCTAPRSASRSSSPRRSSTAPTLLLLGGDISAQDRRADRQRRAGPVRRAVPRPAGAAR